MRLLSSFSIVTYITFNEIRNPFRLKILKTIIFNSLNHWYLNSGSIECDYAFSSISLIQSLKSSKYYIEKNMGFCVGDTEFTLIIEIA